MAFKLSKEISLTMIKRVLPLFLITAILLTGCSTVILENGTLSLEANAVDKIEITNSSADTFTIENRDVISKLVKYINSFTLEDGNVFAESYQYSLHLLDNKGETYLRFTIVSANSVSTDQTYSVNAKDMLQYVESLECDTMTDNELIDALLKGNTLEQLNVLNEEGKISLDKIVSLPKSCPALFELLSRPTVVTSVSSYGFESLKTLLNSTNPELVEKGREWAEILKQLVPEVRESIENMLETQASTD